MLKIVSVQLDENELWQSGENLEDEKFIREFSLNKAGTLVLELGEPFEINEKFNEFFVLIKIDLLKIEGQSYSFKLSENIKHYLNEATLFFSCNMNYFPYGYFYGFTHPSFYHEGKLIMKMNSYDLNFTFIVSEEQVNIFKEHRLGINNISNAVID